MRSREVATEFATRFATQLGVRREDAAHVLMQASPAELVAAQNRLIDQGMEQRLGAFPIGPAVGDDCLPLDPVEAMRRGEAHRVPLIVGTNADEGRLFTRFLPLLPTTEPMVEALLADADPAARERITAAYPGYPDRSACVRLGGDFAFGSAAWQIAEAHGKYAPAYLYRYDFAPAHCTGPVWEPPTPPNCLRSLAFTAASSGRCSPPVSIAEQRGASPKRYRAVGWRSAAPGYPVTAGPPTPMPIAR
ncbi:carboxylesterase family protein [Mycobacterium xenopi 3993]|nr:carboxylesterase family protein [Mycobacterium xenopi 3993]